MRTEEDVNPAGEKAEQIYEPSRVVRDDHAEGLLARLIEQQTARLPSDFFLWCSLGAMGASVYLRLTDRKEISQYVGMWAPSFLIMGVYNKMVKLWGSR